LRKFATFRSLTTNNRWKGDELLYRADVLEEEIIIRKREIRDQLDRADKFGADVSIEAIMASGDVCVVVFGAEEFNFGIVKEAGKRLKEFIGVVPSEIIGKNISVIIPEPFASAHDGMLRKFIERGKGSFSGKTRTVPAINGKGYLQNMQLTLANNQVSRVGGCSSVVVSCLFAPKHPLTRTTPSPLPFPPICHNRVCLTFSLEL
jgi:hypothetical protein